MAALAELVYLNNGHFSIENLEGSYLRQLKGCKKIVAFEGARLIVVNPCAYGSPHYKPAAILTNAPWMWAAARQCRDAPPHTHVPLVGKVRDVDGNLTWYTSLAAEYHVEMCEAWAEEFAKWVSDKDAKETKVQSELMKIGKFQNKLIVADIPEENKEIRLLRGLSRKEERDQENEACIGGLRNPNRAVAKLPKLRTTATGIRRVLENVLDKNFEFVDMVSKIRNGDAGELPEAAVQEARRELCKLFGARERDREDKEAILYEGDLLNKIIEAAEDPDKDIADWVTTGTPAGIVKTIPCRGAFPASEPTKA